MVAIANSDEFRQYCESLERSLRKGKVKWGKADKNKRLTYLRTIILEERFHDLILFSYVFRGTKNYEYATIQGIDLAVANLYPSELPVYVYIDALTKTNGIKYKTKLRQLGCYVKKVRGIRKDENEPLIRLADAVAGATRDLIEHGNVELKKILSLAVKRGNLVTNENIFR